MRKFLRSDKALCRTPSCELDARVLLTARIAAERYRRRSFRNRIFAAAGAAAAVLIAGFFFAMPVKEAAQQENNLLALGDWTKVEQESYNLSCQLASEGVMLAEFTGSQSM